MHDERCPIFACSPGERQHNTMTTNGSYSRKLISTSFHAVVAATIIVSCTISLHPFRPFLRLSLLLRENRRTSSGTKGRQRRRSLAEVGAAVAMPANVWHATVQ